MTVPYREPPAPRRVWGVLTEPSMFRRAESRLRGPYTEEQARTLAHRFVAVNPHGAAQVFATTAWPPRLNWEPVAHPDDGSMDP